MGETYRYMEGVVMGTVGEVEGDGRVGVLH